ncbi:MAG: hypothetical protein IPL62_19950 [Caulobacteraceae bacterium]|nr:hypothetical protein [Caulobacteraceae bacterium]
MRFIAALCALALAACSQPQPAPAPEMPATTAETAAATEVTTDALISGARDEPVRG